MRAGRRRFWRGIVIVGIATPLLYVLALGVGLGVVINRHGNSLGVPYLQFVAPAFLTAAALQVAASAAAFPVTSGFKWQRTFHGMAATPLSPAQICDGQLLWITLRLLVNSAIYLAIMAAFGGARSRVSGPTGRAAAALTASWRTRRRCCAASGCRPR